MREGGREGGRAEEALCLRSPGALLVWAPSENLLCDHVTTLPPTPSPPSLPPSLSPSFPHSLAPALRATTGRTT
jgi:hypothetical protein